MNSKRTLWQLCLILCLGYSTVFGALSPTMTCKDAGASSNVITHVKVTSALILRFKNLADAQQALEDIIIDAVSGYDMKYNEAVGTCPSAMAGYRVNGTWHHLSPSTLNNTFEVLNSPLAADIVYRLTAYEQGQPDPGMECWCLEETAK